MPALLCNQTRGQCNNAEKHTFNFMGYSVRTNGAAAGDWRLTQWFPWDNKTLTAR